MRVQRRSDRTRLFVFAHASARVAIDAIGNELVADLGNNRVQLFDSSGTLLVTCGTGGSAPGQFTQPIGVSVDDTGVIYLADLGNNRIEKFGPSTVAVNTADWTTVKSLFR